MAAPYDAAITLRELEGINGLKMRIAEAGSGPLVLLMHGPPPAPLCLPLVPQAAVTGVP